MRRYLYTLTALSVLALCSLGRAHAQTQLVTNGGFEDGNLTGWTASGGPGAVSSAAGFAHDGTYGFDYNANPGGDLTQTLATTVGATETISFWQHQLDSNNPNEFSLSFEGVTLVDDKNINAGGWTFYTFTVTATQASSVLDFGLRGKKDEAIDSVSVLQSGVGSHDSTTPEGSSLAMFALGGLPIALGFSRKFRRKTA